MLRLLALFLVVLTSLLSAEVAAAACQFCRDSVVVQTRDGQSWSAGQPVTLVVHVADAGDSALPAAAQVVVMQTDGDRTKCLGVPLKLVQVDATGGLYAGLFFPFHPARYDGVIVVGTDVQSINFDVNQMASDAGPAGELPAAEPIDTSAPVSIPPLPAVLGGGLLAGALLLIGVHTRQRRSRQLAVS